MTDAAVPGLHRSIPLANSLETERSKLSARLSWLTVPATLSSACRYGFIFTAVEDRYRAVVLVAGGVKQPDKPWIAEAWPLNFASHIRVPKLMLNGRCDEAYPHKTDVEPLYKLLREPKRLVVYEAGHTPPIEIAVPAINDWLNDVLGPTKRE